MKKENLTVEFESLDNFAKERGVEVNELDLTIDELDIVIIELEVYRDRNTVMENIVNNLAILYKNPVLMNELAEGHIEAELDNLKYFLHINTICVDNLLNNFKNMAKDI